MYCKYCGKIIEDGSLYCEHCGKRIQSNMSETKFLDEVDSNVTVKCMVCGKVLNSNESGITLETGKQICKDCYHAFSGRMDESKKDLIDNDILEVLNHKEDYTCGKLRETLYWLRENEYDDKANELEKYINNLKGKRQENCGTGNKSIMILGIILTIIGIAAMLFCIIRINNDMSPIGLAGIQANYKPPFTSYEKEQIAKLISSIICWVIGIIMWLSERKSNGGQ